MEMVTSEALKAGQKVEVCSEEGFLPYNYCMHGLYLHLEHSHSDSSNLIGQFEVSYFHSDTDKGTTCSALALRACSSWAQLL